MQFAPPRPPRRTRENIVPMINVVFLLLIFFLMTAQIAPPEPFAVTPPESTSATAAEAPATLFIAADGTLAFEAARGQDVFGALAMLPKGRTLLIRADGGLKAAELARLLPRLGAIGLGRVELVTGVAR